ncbi:MAG: hypothetical protein ACK41U_11370 [Paracoccus sp. (in: a-proteobacteria)]|uniref:hypothetical protein n=1 Tax=Paracoccus sp. TaxID=267 RepID=UPI00391A30CF
MTEITASERRLSAALDRIDRVLEAGTQPAAAPLPDTGSAADRDALQASADALAQALAEARDRQRQSAEEAARLSAANEDLAAANRLLIEARDTGGITGDEVAQALEAEIAALRAARAAEMAQMGDIMAELERLLAPEAEAEAGAGADDADGAGPDAPLNGDR